MCKAVTEKEVDAAIEGGAYSREAVTRACRAGGDCGACHGMIEDKIEDHLETRCPMVTACPPATASAERLLGPDQLVLSARKSAA